MKATYQTEYGSSGVLKHGELSPPSIKPGDVLVKNFAASVNPRDWMIRSGKYQLQFLVPKFPLILGSDFAGEVVRVGSRVQGYEVGDRVYGMKNPSEGLATYAETVSVPAKNIALIPSTLSFTEAAGIPLCALTAWQALFEKAALKPGMRVLIVGASGGVGSYAVQIGKALGVHTTGVCSGKNIAMVAGLGADHVIDYQREDFTQDNQAYDIVFDTIGKHSLSSCHRVLKAGGRFVTTIPSPTNLKAMALSKLRSLFSRDQKEASVVMVKSRGSDLDRISKLIEQEQLVPVIDCVLPLEDAAAAHDRSRGLRAKGKIILEVRSCDD